MKIALIGPAYPYRGGIAHHTNMLASYLRKAGHDVDVITFTRQYPKILYPGQSQEEPGAAGEEAREVRSKRMIDSIGPLSWRRTGQHLQEGGYDLVVFQYWLPFFALAFGSISRRVRKSGALVMVIVHNLFPQEKRPGDTQLTAYFFRYCNLAVTQSSTVERQLRQAYPQLPQRMLPHPTYEQFGSRLPVAETRRELGITAPKVILFFGFVRQYKGLDRLLAAMPAIVKRIPDIHLLVVGEFFDDPAPYMKQIEQGGVSDRITVVNRYVANDEVPRWFSAADLLVLPYHKATNSGIVQIGYNFATPAVVTNVGSLGEVVIDGETGFVIDDASPESLASTIERAFHGDTLERFSRNIVAQQDRYGWDSFVEGLLELVGRPSPPAPLPDRP